jgi:8-oxo-dGTP pyrophosphatase MutT (NUDIX family)
MLLIKRAERDGDAWSGQVAFPGGKMNSDDESVLKAAVRETREEVGIDLNRDATLLGYFGSFRTHTGEMDVVPAVFGLKRKVEVMPNPEVSGYKWVGLDAFHSPQSKSTLTFGVGAAKREMPAYVVGDYVVWGLTYKMVEALLERIS